jgi:hypothetical protein
MYGGFAIMSASQYKYQIVTVLCERVAQGQTLSAAAVYFVKGAGAGRCSLLCKWIAGNLGLHLGLPIAPFEIVHVPEALLAFDTGELRDLGAGPAFGSRERQITELTFAAITDDIPESLQQGLLLFDWWIRNGDRMLSEVGGNPNLFLEPGTGELIVIDHNQAFDDSLEKMISWNPMYSAPKPSMSSVTVTHARNTMQDSQQPLRTGPTSAPASRKNGCSSTPR